MAIRAPSELTNKYHLRNKYYNKLNVRWCLRCVADEWVATGEESTKGIRYQTRDIDIKMLNFLLYERYWIMLNFLSDIEREILDIILLNFLSYIEQVILAIKILNFLSDIEPEILDIMILNFLLNEWYWILLNFLSDIERVISAIIILNFFIKYLSL